MREDMAKVIVERPRIGSRDKKARKGYRKAMQRLRWDDQPRREGIGRRAASRALNEHLGPLRRFLFSRVGQPWNKVFAEICARVNRNNAVQDHIRDHLEDIVESQVQIIDRVPCHLGGRQHGEPIRASRGWLQLYVCPKTGILRRLKKPRPAHTPPAPPRRIKVSDRLQCHFLDGAWYVVEVEALPLEMWRGLCSRVDAVLQIPVFKLTDEKAREVYGALVFAISRRLLTKRELGQWPIPTS